MCFVAVLALALASYLAVSNQAMIVGNRGYAKDVSRHLAAMGLERALRSFTAGTFSSWTHPDATTATRTLTIASSNFGTSGITTAINIRVDRYTAGAWSAATPYAVNDMVWYRGVWFHCISANTNQAPPNATYWIGAPAAWSADAKYNSTGTDIVLSGGSAYRCIAANSNQVPPNVTYWSAAYGVAAWNAATSYTVDQVSLLGGTAYRCISAHTNQPPPNLTYWISVPVIYSEGVATLPNGTATIKTQLRATIAPAPLFPNALGATTLVNMPASATIDSYNSSYVTTWNAGTTYNTGDLVYYSTNGYTYCYTNATSSSGNVPTNATYWTTAMPGSSAVIAGGTTSTTAVTVTSARVNGFVAAPSSSTNPYAPLWSYGGTAILTSIAAPTVPTPRVDLTRVSRSPFIPQFDIQSVTGAGNLPNGSTTLSDGATTLGTPGATTPSIYNITGTTEGGSTLAGLYLSDATDVLTITGPVILNVTGTLRTSNSALNASGKIIITSTGSLEVYFTGQLWIGAYTSIQAGSGIINQTFDPKKCILVGTSTANSAGSHYFWAQEPFYGVIYMPSAYLSTFTNVVCYGAFSASNIAYPQAGCLLHYDTSLRTARLGTFIDAPYMITEWRELTDPAEKVTLP